MQTAQAQQQLAQAVSDLAQAKSEHIIVERQLRNGNLDAAARAQLEARQAQLQARIDQAQSRIDAAKAQIKTDVQVPTPVITVPPPVPQIRIGPQWDPDMIIALGGAVIVFILFPIAIGLSRRLWRGRPAAPIPPAINDIPNRLDRLEQAVDAIAIEVERISEGQRFVTKMMAERNGADQKQSLGAGAIEPVRVGERQAVKEERSGG